MTNDEARMTKQSRNSPFLRHLDFVLPSSFGFRPSSFLDQLNSVVHHSRKMSHSLLHRAWYGFWRRVLQVVAVLVYRVRFSGRENIPAAGGVLIVSNHQSHFDPPLVGIGCPRQMNYVARETLFGFRLFGWILKSVGGIPIDRDGFGLRGIKESLKLLKRGEMVLIFPEGTRTSDGEIGRFRPGFTTLAARSNAAILPVAIEGGFQVWPRTKNSPAWAGFAFITASRSPTPKSPAATNAKCSPRSNAASASVLPSFGGTRHPSKAGRVLAVTCPAVSPSAAANTRSAPKRSRSYRRSAAARCLETRCACRRPRSCRRRRGGRSLCE